MPGPSILNTYHRQYPPYADADVAQRYTRPDPDGRKWMDGPLIAKGCQGATPTKAYNRSGGSPGRMAQLDREELPYFTMKGGIRINWSLDEVRRLSLSDV